MSTEHEAWTKRALTEYSIGDRVTVGPAYQGNGHYAPDGAEGEYIILSRVGATNDYKIARVGKVLGVRSLREIWGADWDYIMSASRLTKV